MIRVVLWVLTLLLCHTSAQGAAPAPPKLFCALCGQIWSTPFRVFKNSHYAEPQRLCAQCSALEDHCSSCGIPVRPDAFKVGGTRLLCVRDAAAAVLRQDDAQRLFEETRRELIFMLRGQGILAGAQMKLSLVSSSVLEELVRDRVSGLKPHLETQGLISSKREGDAWLHQIHVTEGLSPLRFRAVCAHEIGHAFLKENVSRALESDTVEGFCELLAYRLMDQMGAAGEKERITRNLYTADQIGAFVQAENEAEFFRVVQWVKGGSDARLGHDNVRHLATSTSASLWPKAVPTAVPQTLVLKGLGGPAHRRFALVNDQTFQTNQVARVRVGSGSAMVECLEIRAHSVLIRIAGELAPMELQLRN